MKKSILKITALTFITGAILTGCESTSQKVETAQNDVKEANMDLANANKEYEAEVEKYRKEAAEKIAINEKSIAEYKARKEDKKNDAKADYDNQIAELENKNSDMKKRLDDYKMESLEQWEKFKTEFNHDMDELGQSFKDLVVTNVK